jgi:probable HAF family extracellular repeat protein
LLGASFLATSTVLAEDEAGSYTFLSIDLPNVDGKLGFTYLGDINDIGQVVGGFVAGQPSGFLIDPSYRTISIQCPHTTFTAVLKLNNLGEITGRCSDDRRPPVTERAFVRDREGEYTLLSFPGARITAGTGMNDDKQVVGYFLEEAGTYHGFLWGKGRFITIDVPFHNVITIPQGINDRGQIVGYYFDADCGCNTQGFLNDRGNIVTLSFPGAQATGPTDINNRGQIVGFYADSEDVHHGFLFEKGYFTRIEVPFGGRIPTEISGINDRGQVVGRYIDLALLPTVTNHGFVATPNGRGQRTNMNHQNNERRGESPSVNPRR